MKAVIKLVDPEFDTFLAVIVKDGIVIRQFYVLPTTEFFKGKKEIEEKLRSDIFKSENNRCNVKAKLTLIDEKLIKVDII